MLTQINCVIHGDIPDGGLTCSFFMSHPINHKALLQAFPFEGDYRFRVKLRGDWIGCRDVEYVWMDLIEHDDELVFIREMTAVDVQVLPLELLNGFDFDSAGDADEDQEYESYLESINQSMNIHPHQRPHRVCVEKGSKGGLLQKLSKTVKKGTQLAPITLQSVAMSASSMWNSVKATASSLQHSFAHSSSALSDTAEENLSQLSDDLSCKYNDSNKRHAELLREVWSVQFPGTDFERVSSKWKEAGWQAVDPIPDLKASGVLSLRALSYFGVKYPTKTAEMLSKNKANIKTNYPYSIVGVNTTLLLSEQFHLRNQGYLSVQSGHWELFEDKDTFFELFCIVFLHIDSIWTHRKAVRGDFGKIIGEAKALVSLVLSQSPKSLQEFKHFAMDEGMLVMDM